MGVDVDSRSGIGIKVSKHDLIKNLFKDDPDNTEIDYNQDYFYEFKSDIAYISYYGSHYSGHIDYLLLCKDPLKDLDKVTERLELFRVFLREHDFNDDIKMISEVLWW
jgi:hypothetical protein